MAIKIFKTNVKNQEEVSFLENQLANLFGSDEQWNFDLEDCDNILRVDSFIQAECIVSLLEKHGFFCQELE